MKKHIPCYILAKKEETKNTESFPEILSTIKLYIILNVDKV